MPRAPADVAAAGIGHGDRVVYLGIGQGHGRHGDAVSPRRDCAGIRFDDGTTSTCRTADLHPIPRRPPPMW